MNNRESRVTGRSLGLLVVDGGIPHNFAQNHINLTNSRTQFLLDYQKRHVGERNQFATALKYGDSCCRAFTKAAVATYGS
jgi:hypothetical protein